MWQQVGHRGEAHPVKDMNENMKDGKYPEVFTCKMDIVEIQNDRAECHDQEQELPTKF